MNPIQSFKALFQEHLDNLISYASIHPYDRDDLVTFQKDLEPVETLSDLCALFKDHNRLLPLCMHQAYITELSRMIGEDKLRAHQILINPTSIPDTLESKEYIALYDRPTKTQQKGQYVVYIGPGEPHITGGKAETFNQRQVSVGGDAELIAYERTHVEAFGKAKITLYNVSTCTAKDEAIIIAQGYNRVVAQGNNRVELYQNSWGISERGQQQWTIHGNSLLYVKPEHKTSDTIQVQMKHRAVLFNASHANVIIDHDTMNTYRGKVVECADNPYIDQELGRLFGERATESLSYSIDKPLPIDESRELLQSELPSQVSSHLLSRFHEAQNEQDLCDALACMLIDHPSHTVSPKVLAKAITSDTLRNYGFYLRPYEFIDERQGHVFIFGHRIINTQLSDPDHIYHLYGNSVLVSDNGDKVIASDHACLVQFEGTQNRVDGCATALLISKGPISASGQGHVCSLGQDNKQEDPWIIYKNQPTHIQLEEHATALCFGDDTQVVAKGESRAVCMNEATIDLYDHSEGAAIVGSQEIFKQDSPATKTHLLNTPEEVNQFLAPVSEVNKQEQHRKSGY